jgi:hypothetical protein
MSLVETQAQETAFTYNISPNGACGDWYWEVMCDGDIVARGLAATPVEARVDAIRSARVFDADVAFARLYGPSGVFMGDVAPEAVDRLRGYIRAVSE